MTPRREQLEGRTHLVVPVVLVVEGVLNGSQGALLYPLEELRQSASAWNGRPVVVYHPDMATGGVAGHPRVFDRQRIGTLFNCRIEANKLVADAWLDEARLNAVDTRVAAAVRSGKPVEVSTGLFTDADAQPGSWRGRAYSAVARNHRPDHLAVLPDQRGACSIADGAGLCRNETELEPLIAPQSV